jgi:glycine cleavage system pyridoxal-binding protein P
LPAAVLRGLRWLDAEVRDADPSPAALLLAEHFQTSFRTALALDHVFLPEETVAYSVGRLLAMADASRRPPVVTVAASMDAERRRVVAAWAERLGLTLELVTEPAGRPIAGAACVVETPNAAGLLENLAAWRAAASPDVPLVVCSNDPLVFFTGDLPVGRFADAVIFDVAALATRGDEAAAVGTTARLATTVAGLFVDGQGDEKHLARSDDSPVEDEPRWEPVFVAALLAAELGPVGFRRRARAVLQRRRWLEAALERRGLPPLPTAGQRFREARFEIPRWTARRDNASAEGFRLDDASGSGGDPIVVRSPLAARREDVLRLAEVMAGG